MGFNDLYKIDCRSFIEEVKQGGSSLKYLSWANAWKLVKEQHNDASYVIERFENNLPYVFDEKTGYMVFTKVTIDGITHEMWLPVLDGANKPMLDHPYEYTTKYNGTKTVLAANMFDINKTIMRCLTKNLAMFGLGLYIYEGEDIPRSSDDEDKQVSNQNQQYVKPSPIANPKEKQPQYTNEQYQQDLEFIKPYIENEKWSRYITNNLGYRVDEFKNPQVVVAIKGLVQQVLTQRGENK